MKWRNCARCWMATPLKKNVTSQRILGITCERNVFSDCAFQKNMAEGVLALTVILWYDVTGCYDFLRITDRTILHIIQAVTKIATRNIPACVTVMVMKTRSFLTLSECIITYVPPLQGSQFSWPCRASSSIWDRESKGKSQYFVSIFGQCFF